MRVNPYQPPREAPGSETESSCLRRTITLQGSMSVADVLHTQGLILRQRWGYGLACVLIYIAFVLALGTLSPAGSFFGNTFLVLGLLVAPGILPFTLLMVWLRLRRDAHRREGIFAVTRSVLSEQGIDALVDQRTVFLPWSSFGSFLDSHRVALLFLKESNDHLIVARAKMVNPKDWSALIDFLYQRFPRR